MAHKPKHDKRIENDNTKVTVYLTAETMKELENAVSITGLTKTDTINQAVGIYAEMVKTALGNKAISGETLTFSPDGKNAVTIAVL